ncbi:PREDICTED: phosphatidylserine synthase 2-like [Priapulus caudatus]|uniref:Phosphatidylserine synthase n=1 Tax=Priapulus caudatus TaxID=37621 RepID=A0ABM1EMM3_PRICU|nr:PREDICTED: phosphatidylserine synthase 2-like [Priapulus caudatus]
MSNFKTTGQENDRGQLNDELHRTTAHNWEEYKQHSVWDDGTNTFFWRAHTLTVLFLMTCSLLYVAVFEEPNSDSNYNAKRGLIAVVCAFLLFGVIQTPDGPFKRPHPVVWRFVFCISILYELALIFILFQTVGDARKLMVQMESSLGKPLPEQSYGDDCTVYDPNHPDGAFHNVWDKIDCFVPSHFIGWYAKTLIMRDYWLCMVISIMFEVLEYTLEHQLPNFSECWWDHWIMDVLVCNGLGIYFGMMTLNYLKIKPYHWRGLWSIPGYRCVIDTFIPPSVFVAPSCRQCRKLGRQAWLLAAMLITELLIVVKFGSATVTKPLPRHMQLFWTWALLLLVIYTVWRFFIAKGRDATTTTTTRDKRACAGGNEHRSAFGESMGDGACSDGAADGATCSVRVKKLS